MTCAWRRGVSCGQYAGKVCGRVAELILCRPIFLIQISRLCKKIPTYSQAYAPILCITSASFFGMAALGKSVLTQKSPHIADFDGTTELLIRFRFLLTYDAMLRSREDQAKHPNGSQFRYTIAAATIG